MFLEILDIINSKYIDLKTIITIIFALVGLWVTHYFTSRRDRQNKIRDINITYVKSAYTSLSKGVVLWHQKQGKESSEMIESAFAEILIHGTTEQINAVELVMDQIKSGSNEFALDEILLLLRNYLRKELKLPEETRTIRHLS